ncbi:MFS transporter [Desulfurococcaceae archaeon MEX13E-LK6-19]|nr:MFS transporter [Desulfurococcaceae archaeon MEX13E-LK6-19]
MIAAIVDTLWKEGLIPGTKEDWRVYAGLLRTIPQIIGLALSFLWGVLADKIGRRKVLAVLGVMMGLSLLAVATARSYIELMIYFTIFGIAITGIGPVIYAFIADVVPSEKRGSGYAVYYASSVLGMAIGLVIAGILLTWRYAYLTTGLAVLVFAIPLYVISRGVTIGYAEKKEVGKYGLRKALKALAIPTVLIIILQIIAWTIPWGMLSLWAVNYFEVKWGVSKKSASLVVSIAVLSIALGHVIGGTLSDRRVKKGDILARVKIPIIGIIIGYAAMVAMLTYPYPYGKEDLLTLLPPAILALCGMMFTTFAYPNINSVISDVVKPEIRGTVFSVYNVLNTIGWAVGPVIYALLSKYFMDIGFEEKQALMYSAVLIVSLWIISLIAWIILAKTYPRDKARAEQQ